jgi:hypothetical protein
MAPYPLRSPRLGKSALLATRTNITEAACWPLDPRGGTKKRIRAGEPQ